LDTRALPKTHIRIESYCNDELNSWVGFDQDQIIAGGFPKEILIKNTEKLFTVGALLPDLKRKNLKRERPINIPKINMNKYVGARNRQKELNLRL